MCNNKIYLCSYSTSMQHEFVNRFALCSTLVHPLVKVLEAPPPKAKIPSGDDSEEEVEECGEKKVSLYVPCTRFLLCTMHDDSYS